MLRRILAYSVPLFAIVAGFAAGCSANNDATGSREDQICTPGQYGYCLCKNGQDGTRLCKKDGKSYGACMMGGTEECPGGEVPLDDAGRPIPETDSGTPDPSTHGCPGRPITVSGAQPFNVTGDTTSSTSQFGGTAGGACEKGNNTPEEVYELTPAEDGALNVKMTPLGFDGVIYARTGVCATGAQAACGNSSNASGVAETLRFNVIGGEKVWLFADGANGGKGSYTLDVTLTPGPFCGNGKIDPGEACDDKNKVAGDGCGPNCQPDGNPNGADVCPGMPITVWGTEANGVSARSQTTTGYGTAMARLAGACTSGGSTSTGANAPNRVYAITTKKAGTLVVTTSNSNFDHQLYARSTCADQNSEIICASNVSGTGGETLQFTVSADTTYYVIVDGLVTGSGNYDINFKIQ